MNEGDLFNMIKDFNDALKTTLLLKEYYEEMLENTRDLFSKYEGDRAQEIISPHVTRFTRMANVLASNILLSGRMATEENAEDMEKNSVEDVYYAICEGYLLGYYDRGQDVLLSMQVSPDQSHGRID